MSVSALALASTQVQLLWDRHFHQGRGGRAKLAVTTNLCTRVVLAAVSLLTVPITIGYLGTEGYGLLTVMSSVVGWLQFSNLGIGSALQNSLIQARADGDIERQQELVSTVVFTLIGIALILLGAGVIAFPVVNWLQVFPPSTNRFAAEIPPALAVIFLGFVSSVVLSFVHAIYSARQELHIGTLPVLAAGLLSLAGVVVAVRLDLGLIGVVCASTGSPALVQWAFAIWTLWLRGIPELKPRIAKCSRAAWRSVSGQASSFLLLQICCVAFFQADAFIIAHFLSVQDVTPYSVAQRVFVQFAGLFAVASGSLWAAYGDAKARRDAEWIRRTQRSMEQLFITLYLAFIVAMVALGHYVLKSWVGAAAPSTAVIAAVGAYFCAREWTTLQAMLLNGLDIIRPQVWVLAITAVLIITLSLLLVRPFGAAGLAIGGVVGFSALSAWYLRVLANRAIGELERTPEACLSV